MGHHSNMLAAAMQIKNEGSQKLGCRYSALHRAREYHLNIRYKPEFLESWNPPCLGPWNQNVYKILVLTWFLGSLKPAGFGRSSITVFESKADLYKWQYSENPLLARTSRIFWKPEGRAT